MHTLELATEVINIAEPVTLRDLLDGGVCIRKGIRGQAHSLVEQPLSRRNLKGPTEDSAEIICRQTDVSRQIRGRQRLLKIGGEILTERLNLARPKRSAVIFARVETCLPCQFGNEAKQLPEEERLRMETRLREFGGDTLHHGTDMSRGAKQQVIRIQRYRTPSPLHLKSKTKINRRDEFRIKGFRPIGPRCNPKQVPSLQPVFLSSETDIHTTLQEQSNKVAVKVVPALLPEFFRSHAGRKRGQTDSHDRPALREKDRPFKEGNAFHTPSISPSASTVRHKSEDRLRGPHARRFK